jgi:uncharacterized protein YkwD
VTRTPIWLAPGWVAMAASILSAGCAAPIAPSARSESARLSVPDGTGPGSPAPGAPGASTRMVPLGAAARYFSTASRASPPAPADVLRDAIVHDAHAASRRAGLPPPIDDARLDWAMTDIARQVRGDDLPAAEAVDFLLAHYGIVEPSPQIMLAGTTAGGEQQIVENAHVQLAELLRSGPLGRLGVGVERIGAEIRVAIGVQPTHVELTTSVPRRLPRGGHCAIAARIGAGFESAALVVTGPDGRVREEPPSQVAGRLGGQLRCVADGRHQVEIAAFGPAGPAVLANFPVYCGVEPPGVWVGATSMRPETSDPAEVEREIVALINRDRARGGLPAVAVDARLVAIARAHSQDMADHDFVGHVSPRTGTAMDRVRRAGLRPSLVAENVGRAYSADEAEAGFLASPGHRGNILDAHARRVGVGVVFGPAQTGTRPILVTQLFSD